ncbi:large tegument protein [Saimiriine betaherpesvirus 4]|uniref:Large tegument protein n=1 Tax=Saimiriine betaherpesvirus 4 TaxID=1535247 RepID=G8XSW2_9BETA|nr:large tegument protein [Saimiriine betaherpesvirus 4]AEV80908.1 large tegument protein [Saimiriine betaherpesvirus 4]
MQIYQASCDQASRRFGPRAGSQCVCNCLLYIHTLHIKGAHYTLNKDALDLILQEGSRLDTITEQELLKKNIKPHVYRLGEEVSRTIQTSFGRTAHALSRPFNGTAETRNLDGYVCLGIFDFLLYAYNKPKPVYILVTVDALARAIVFTDHDIFVFDPHASDRCPNAAVYQCRSLDDVVTILTSFGLILGSFYYDALIIYMIDLSIFPIPASEIDRTIISLYRDPDISLPIPIPPGSPTTPIKPPPTSVPALEPVPSPSTPIPTSKKTKAEKRKSDTPHKTSKKNPRKTTHQTYNCTEALPSLTRYEHLVEQIEKELTLHTLKAPPTSGWTLYSQTSGLPFDESFLTERVHQLTAQTIDNLAMMRYFVNPSDDTVRDRTRATLQTHLRQLWGFSQATDTFLAILVKQDLNLVRLYNVYLSRRKAPWTTLERLLGSKIYVVFTHWGENHGPRVKQWTQNLIRHIEKTDIHELEVKIRTYLWSNPLSVQERFVCLKGEDRDTVSSLVATRQSVNSEQLAKQQNSYRHMSECIAHIDINRLDQLSPQILNKNLSEMSKVDHVTKSQLKKQTENQLRDLYNDLNTNFQKILADKNNQILSGSLPGPELTQLQKQVNQALTLCQTLKNLNLYDTNIDEQLHKLTEYITFILTGNASTSISYPENLTALRKEFSEVIKQKEYNETKINELLNNIEFILKDPTSRSSNISMSMLRAQLQELSNLDIKKVSGAETRFQAISKLINSLKQEEDLTRQFVASISYSNMPNNQTLKRQLRLKDLLRDDEDLRKQYISHLAEILNTVVDKLVTQEFWPPATFELLKELINQLPPNNLTRDLRVSTSIFAQLSKKIETVSKATDKKNIPLLEDMTQFFLSHGESFSALMSSGIGLNLKTIYEKYKAQLEAKYLQQAEDTWKTKARELKITSPNTVEAFLRTAPSHTAASAVTPLLEEKLKAYIEEESKKIQQENQQRLTESQNRIDLELTRVVDALRSETPSLVLAVDLESVKNILSALGPNTQAILEKFNRNVLSALSKIDKQIDRSADKKIYELLAGKPAKITGAYSGDPNILKTALSHLRHLDAYLTQETKTILNHMYRQLLFITTELSDRPAATFTETEYESRFLQYQECQRELLSNFETAKSSIIREANDLQGAVKKQQSTKATEKPPTLNRQVVSQLSYPLTPDLKDTAFHQVLEEHLDSARQSLTKEIDLLDIQLKSITELQQAKTSSLIARWQDLVTRHKVDSLEIPTPEAKLLLSDPVTALTETVQKAATDLPYLISEKTLKWVLMFIQDAIQEISQSTDHPQNGHLVSYHALQQKAQQHLTTVTTDISNNASCENFVAHQDTITITEDIIQQAEAAWRSLQPKRVAGGEARYRQIQSDLNKMRHSLSDLALKESLATEYFELLNGLHSFSYGLDFTTQLQKIRQLQMRFTELSKKEKTSSNDSSFPVYQKNLTASIPTSSFLRGLVALEKRVLDGYKYLSDLVNKQFLINKRLEDVPSLILPAKSDQASTDRLSRLQFSRDTQLYEIIDVFGDHQIVTPNGTPISLTPTYGNVIFKYLALHRSQHTASKRHARLKNIVTSRYKAIMVSVAIAGTLKSFWKPISDYDLRPLLTNDEIETFSRETNTLVNLKIFAYVVTTAWTLQSQDITETGSRTKLSIAELCMILTTLYPEYIYTILKHSIQSSVTSLLHTLKQDIVNEALNTTQNPPPWEIDELKGFCIEQSLWSTATISRILWDNDFMRQLCQDVGPYKMKSGKLLQYILAVSILPQDVLQCLWLELKPQYAEQYVSLYDFVQALFDIFSYPYDVTVGTPANDPQLTSGEKILQSISLRKKCTQEEEEMSKIFIETETVLDYALGSLVFGVPVCCAIRVADISGGRTLLARHLEYTPNDQDFKRILRSRDLNFGYLISQTWTNTPIEQCWFQSQAKKIRDYLQHPVKLDFTPLVIYGSLTRYTESVLKPPLTDHKPNSRIVIDNPFPIIPLEQTPTPEPLSFQRVPVSIDFLQDTPPRLAETHSEHSETVEPATAGDSVASNSFSEPVFRQNDTADTILSKDDVTTVSPSAATASFGQQPITNLTHNIQKALHIIKMVRTDLRALTESIIETTRRLDFLYL